MYLMLDIGNGVENEKNNRRVYKTTPITFNVNTMKKNNDPFSICIYLIK